MAAEVFDVCFARGVGCEQCVGVRNMIWYWSKLAKRAVRSDSAAGAAVDVGWGAARLM